MNIGVLAMQGSFKEHINILNKLNVNSIEVRNEANLDNIDGIIIPGGESTAIGKLMKELNIHNKLKSKIEAGLPVWGTCAGMILLAKEIENQQENYLSAMDIQVRRNAYGRQLGSFTTSSNIKYIGENIEMVFIRAPYINKVGDNVEILSIVNNNIVAAKENNMLVTSFHPELTADDRVHKYFLTHIKVSMGT